MSQNKDEYINLFIKQQNGQGLNVKIKPLTRFAKMFDTYTSKTGLDMKSIRFTFEGERLSGESTAKSAGLIDGDIIDVLQEQTGGSIRSFHGTIIK